MNASLILLTLISANLVNVLSAVFDPVSLCRSVSCRAGRECRVLSSGIPECVCRERCPKRKKHPVCGSDGMSYDNHCELHRHACLSGKHIRPNFLDHSCHEDPFVVLKKWIAKASEEIKEEEKSEIKVPVACFQNDRDRMREFLMSWMTLTGPKHEWYRNSLNYTSLLHHHFISADSDTNGNLDSSELFEYMQKNRTNQRKKDLDKTSRKMRILCLDALVEEGDSNSDWRLNKEEFLRLLSHDYSPSNKFCLRDHVRFEDSTRTKVDCNGCVCACGKWICTSKLCTAEKHPEEYLDNETDFYTGQYDDMDNIVQ